MDYLFQFGGIILNCISYIICLLIYHTLVRVGIPNLSLSDRDRGEKFTKILNAKLISRLRTLEVHKASMMLFVTGIITLLFILFLPIWLDAIKSHSVPGSFNGSWQWTDQLVDRISQIDVSIFTEFNVNTWFAIMVVLLLLITLRTLSSIRKLSNSLKQYIQIAEEHTDLSQFFNAWIWDERHLRLSMGSRVSTAKTVSEIWSGTWSDALNPIAIKLCNDYPEEASNRMFPMSKSNFLKPHTTSTLGLLLLSIAVHFSFQ